MVEQKDMIQDEMRSKCRKLEKISLLVMIVVGKIISTFPFLVLFLFFVNKGFTIQALRYPLFYYVLYLGGFVILLTLFPIILSLRKSMKEFVDQHELAKAEQKLNFLVVSLVLMVLLILPFLWIFIDYLGYIFPLV